MKSLSREDAQNALPVLYLAGSFRVFENDTAPASPSTTRPMLLGQMLVETGALKPGDLVKALALQNRQNVRLGHILVAHGMVDEDEVLAASCRQWKTRAISPLSERPDPRLVDHYTPVHCIRDGILPWQRVGSVTVIVTSRPELFERRRAALEEMFGRVALALCTESELLATVDTMRRTDLAYQAETRVQPDRSCRTWNNGGPQRKLLAALCAVAAAILIWPIGMLGVLAVWAIATLFLSFSVKLWSLGYAVLNTFRDRDAFFVSSRKSTMTIARLPVVSVMVPLFKEENTADRLVQRIARITYPKELLDICLVVEEEDAQTRTVLSRTRLPPWMRVITVPRGTVQTKPRALNYALDFCRGSIIGIWDAEDAPAADQIHKVVRRFHERGPDLACVQGQLDFYNTTTNWLSRCFTIEYASWFRIMLPGMEKLGFAIPLGGTTLFFQRDALEKLGGWDAHNVTEDADLGMRLAREGYRTEMIASVTMEEANCRVIPWIKQRSRWIKGYAITYAVHMRDPALLWRELGAWKFVGFQILFLSTLSQFLLAPLLWTFWFALSGFGHPLVSATPFAIVVAVATFFVLAELVTIAIGVLGVYTTGRRRLIAWVPTTLVYFPLGAFAAYKALWELILSPFYWDKTSHGHHDEGHEPG